MRNPPIGGLLLCPLRLRLLALTALVLPGLALHGQMITGTIEAIDHPSYAGIASGFTLSDAREDGDLIYDGEVLIFCSDLAASSFDEDISSYPYDLTAANSPFFVGELTTMDIWARHSTAQDEALALAQVHWLVDNYYESSVLNGDSTSQYAFQNVVWEIFGDGGTASGLDFTNGNIIRSKFGPDGSRESPELWATMNSLLAAVENSGVSADYQAQHQILAVHDTRSGYQDYVGLAASPTLMQIPEPSSFSLVGAAGLLLILRRNRDN